MRQLGVTPEQADALKTGGTVSGVDRDSVLPVLASVTEFICDEIQRALTFFWTAATDESLGAVLLSGGTARIPDLAEQLRTRLDCPVDIADPFRRLEMGSGVDRHLMETNGPAMAVAIGLATRRPGDK